MRSNKIWIAGFAALLAGCTSRNGELTPKLLVTPTANLVTAENGIQSRFNVSLTERPDRDVTLRPYSDNAAEGVADPAELHFTHDDWNIAHVVTVRGVDDPDKDGAQLYHVAFGDTESADSAFVGLHADPVAVTNLDDESPNVLPSVARVEVGEGKSGTFFVKLTSRPRGKVTLAATSAAPSRVTVTPAQLEFFPNAWDKAIAVTVKVLDDNVIDGGGEVAIAFGRVESDDTDYLGIKPPDVTVVAKDNDKSGVVTTSLPTSIWEGESRLFTVKLAAQPTADVELPLTSSASQIVVTPATLTFTASDWATEKTVTVVVAHDQYAPATNESAEWVRVGKPNTTDAHFSSLAAIDFKFTAVNTDVPALVLSSTYTHDTSEHDVAATCQSFTISPTTRPGADVTVQLVSDHPDEGRADLDAVVLGAGVLDAKTFKVCGQDDNVVDGSKPFTITLSVKSTNDARYATAKPVSLSFINDDDDATGEYCSSAIALTAGEKLTGQSTVNRNDDFSLTTCGGFNMPGRDAAYAITIPAGQTLRVTLSSTTYWYPALAIIKDCAASGGTCLASSFSNYTLSSVISYKNSAATPLPVVLVVDNGATYYYGSYDLLPELLP
jgi:hypothetical protein